MHLLGSRIRCRGQAHLPPTQQLRGRGSAGSTSWAPGRGGGPRPLCLFSAGCALGVILTCRHSSFLGAGEGGGGKSRAAAACVGPCPGGVGTYSSRRQCSLTATPGRSVSLVEIQLPLVGEVL